MINTFEDIDGKILKQLTCEYNVIDADNFLKTLVNENFPFGFKDIPDEIILLKIIYLKNENDLDSTRINPFYFANEDDVENIKGIFDGADYEGERFMLKVKTKKENIDVEETLRNNLIYQFEYSTTLKPNSNVEIISLEKI